MRGSEKKKKKARTNEEPRVHECEVWSQAHQKNTKPPSAPAVIKDLLHRFNNIKTLCHRKRRVRSHQSHAEVTHAGCWPRPPTLLSLSPSPQKSLLTFMYKYIQFIDDCCWAVWGRGCVCACVLGGWGGKSSSFVRSASRTRFRSERDQWAGPIPMEHMLA